MYEQLKVLHCSGLASHYQYGMDFIAFIFGVKNVTGTEKKMIAMFEDLQEVFLGFNVRNNFIMDFQTYIFSYSSNKSRLYAPVKRGSRCYPTGWFMIEESLSRSFDDPELICKIVEVVKAHAFKISRKDHSTTLLLKKYYTEDVNYVRD